MLLDLNTFFVKERVGFLKLTDTYDIFDPTTQAQVGIAKEEPPSWAKFLRLLVNKALLPTRVNVYEQEGQPPLFSIQASPFRMKVIIVGGDGATIGSFKTRAFSLRGKFRVFDAQNQQFADVTGDWKGWNFKFVTANGQELGTVTKKWAGFTKEFLTSADNYVIALNEGAANHPGAKILLLCAGLAVDIVYKEGE